MTALKPTVPHVADSGAELTALAEHFCVRAFAAGALFCAAAPASAIAMLPLRDSATDVPWSTPTVILAALLAVAALVVARFPAPVYRALSRRPALELVAVVIAAALLAYPLRSELWWPSCALLMLVAHVAPLLRTWAYCAAVLVTNLIAHAFAGDLSDTPAVSIIGLWIGFGFWTTLVALLVDRIASHLMRVDLGATNPPSAPRPEPSPAETAEPPPTAAASTATDDEMVAPPLALPAPAAQRPTDRMPALTKRQLEVVVLLADGLRYDEIAASLSISVRQVQRHAAGAVQRLGVHNANELVAVAVRSGLVPPKE